MTDKRMLVCLVATLAAMGAALSAHYSHAVYGDSSIALKNATVTGLIWGNPHVILTFAVKDAKGNAAAWSPEAGSPTSLSRIGWNRNSVKAGDTVTIEPYPARNGARVGRLAKVIFPDGRPADGQPESKHRHAIAGLGNPPSWRVL